MTAQGNDPTENAPRKSRVWRRLRRGFLLFVAVVSLSYAALVLWAMDRPIIAPDWVRDRIEQRISTAMPGMQIRFGSVAIKVEKGWRPRVQLRDVDLRDDAGAPLVSLTELEAGIAMRPLFEGQIKPRRIRLSGASATLRRAEDGSFNLSVGETLRPVGQAPGLAQLIDGLDSVLITPQFTALRQIEVEALALRYEDARAGRAWNLDGGRLLLDRNGEELSIRADAALLGGYDYVTSLEANYSSRIGTVAAEFGATFQDVAAADVAAELPALAWLTVVRAPLAGALRASVDDQGKLASLSGTLQIDKGVLQPNDSTRPIPFDHARTYFTYAPDTRTLTFDELSGSSPWVTGRAEGKATLQGLENGFPTGLLAQFRLSKLSANPDKLYPAPVAIEEAVLDMRLTLAPFSVTLGQLSIVDQGALLIFDGRLDATQAGWDLALNGKTDEVQPERILALWPERAAPNTRDWIAQNVVDARVRNAQFALRVKPDRKPDVFLGFQFDQAEAKVIKTMPPLTGAAGYATLMDNRFVITAERGQVMAAQGGAFDVAGTSFIVPDVRIKNTPAQIRLQGRGTITSALSLLDSDPFNVLTKAGQPVTLADGRTEVKADLSLALKRKLAPEEITYDAKATLSNVRSTTLVPGRVLAASHLAVTADGKALTISGQGRLGEVPFEGAWSTSLEPGSGSASLLVGDLTLDQRFVDEFGIGLPPGMIAGSTTGALRLSLDKGRAPSFTLVSGLKGLGISIPQIGWSLPRGGTGKLEVVGALTAPATISALSLSAPGLKADGKLSLTSAGGLDRLSLSRVVAGSWLDAPVDLVGRGKNASPAVEVRGGRIDLRQTTIGAGGAGSSQGGASQGGASQAGSSQAGSSQGGGPISLALDRLQISDGIALTGFRGEFSTAKGFDGSFTGSVNGAAPVRGRVVPYQGRSAFRITSDDAGRVFAAAGLLKKAYKGDLDLTLRPQGNAGNYDGVLAVKNVWLREAPAMAALLNAVSVVGLLEQLGGNGILFSEVDADFRLTPTQAIVTKSSAIGSSLGISMDGIYDMASDKMDMQGVFSPIYLINGIGSIFTRKGEGLLGFNYRIRGTADNPRVSVNPLSIFTPGMFREIFRRPPPKVSP